VDLSRYPPADVIAALAPCLGPARAARLDAVARGRLVGVAAVLEDLRDPHNAGAALRSCEAMGVLSVHVVTAAQRFRTSVRVTQGCEKWLDVERWPDAADCARALQARGYRLYAAAPDGALTVEELPTDRPIALAFGNEHVGLSPRLAALADGAFRIPMYGFSQSLNVSVSVAVSLHVATSARRRALGRPGDLDDEALAALRARYYALDLEGAPAIVERRLAGRGG
jgi:tRNA (guanosine-2'-O-)-methyltransferase